MNDAFFEQVLSAIYDCAVDPSGWDAALGLIRDELDLSYLLLHFLKFPPGYPDEPPEDFSVGTPWDQDWLRKLEPLLPSIPHFDRMRSARIDEPVTQLQFIDEAAFQATDFYRAWVAPQGLRDNCLTNIVRRDDMIAMLSGASGRDREAISAADTAVLARFSPHIRRALLISDLLDETRTRALLQARLLDGLSVALFLVGQSGQISFANTAGEALLSRNTLVSGVGNKLCATTSSDANALRQSIQRACTGDDASIGLWGNGIPLFGTDGSKAVAYVLPLGRSDKRHTLGNGMAAIAITTGQHMRLPEIEVLMALTGLTAAEARVALAIAQGHALQDIAAEQSVTVETLRKHLKSAYQKTGSRSQHALGAYMNTLRRPFAEPTGL